MKEMTEFQIRAVMAGAERMLNGDHFSICDLDNLVKLTGEGNLSGEDYQALRAVHCVNWGAMGKPLADMVKVKALEHIGITDEQYKAFQSSKRNQGEPYYTLSDLRLEGKSVWQRLLGK